MQDRRKEWEGNMAMNLTRRKFVTISGAAAGVAVMGAFAGCSSNEKKEETKKEEAPAKEETKDLLPAKIGYWGGTCEAPIMIAEAKGFYKECGVDAEVFQITSGTSELIANNDIDFFEATPNFLPGIYAGLKIKLVDNVHTGCIQGVARPESGIKSYKDLEGKKVGMFSEGDMAQLFIQAEMGRDGIDYSKTEWLAYSDGGAAMAFKALADGELDALTWFDPYGEIGELAGYTKFFNNAVEPAYKDYTCCYLAATQHIVDTDPEVVKRVCKAMKMAGEFLTENPKEAAQVIQDSGYVAESKVILDAYGIKDTEEDLHERLIKSYTWCAGDKSRYDKSATANWDILYYGSDIMTDAPAAGPGSKEYDEYVAKLVEKGYEYFGE